MKVNNILREDLGLCDDDISNASEVEVACQFVANRVE